MNFCTVVSGYFLLIFCLYNRYYNKRRYKTDFKKCKTCDVSITLMTSCVGDVAKKVRKNVFGAFTVLDIISVLLKHI